MTSRLVKTAGVVGMLVSLPIVGHSAGLLTNGLPPAGGTQYPSTLPLTGNELLPADTALPNGLNPASEAVSTQQLQGFLSGSAGSGGWRNALIGGDAGTNLWQRGTLVGSITTTFLYTADRWFAWSGTSTTMSVAQDTTAAEVPAGYSMAFKVARTGSGVVQSCFAQVVESANMYRFQGQTAEFVQHVYSGAGFSAANTNLQMAIVYGTVADEGAQKLAYGYNAGGGGSTGWTGQANAVQGTVAIGQAQANRVVAVATVPATAKELAVVTCWTPVGASPSNDYVALSGIQLDVNPALAGFAGTVGQAGVNSALTAGTYVQIPASTFERRPIGVENLLQFRYYYQLNESATIQTRAPCKDSSVTLALCLLTFPVQMRVAPTMTYTAGFAVETTAAGGTLGNCSALATSTVVTSTVSTVNNVLVACTATTVPAAGTIDVLYDNNGSGVIKASSEL